MRFVRDHLDRMKDVHAGARRLLRVTGAFVRMAETFLGEYVQGSDASGEVVVGKRKRSVKKVAEQQEDGVVPTLNVPTEEPMDLDFLRPLQPQSPLRSIQIQGAAAPDGVVQSVGMPPVQQQQQQPIDPVSQPEAVNPLTASSLLNMPGGQTVLAPDQGPLDFDWVLWDQSLAHDLSPMDLFQVDDAQSLDWLMRASMMTDAGGTQGLQGTPGGA